MPARLNCPPPPPRLSRAHKVALVRVSGALGRHVRLRGQPRRGVTQPPLAEVPAASVCPGRPRPRCPLVSTSCPSLCTLMSPRRWSAAPLCTLMSPRRWSAAPRGFLDPGLDRRLPGLPGIAAAPCTARRNNACRGGPLPASTGACGTGRAAAPRRMWCCQKIGPVGLSDSFHELALTWPRMGGAVALRERHGAGDSHA
jgi:hypothetical protein